MFFFFKHNTAYEMLISDWSSDVCSSDLGGAAIQDRLDVEPVLAVELRNRPGLPEMFDAQRSDPVSPDGAEPAEGHRMTVDDRHQAGVLRKRGEQPLQRTDKSRGGNEVVSAG